MAPVARRTARLGTAKKQRKAPAPGQGKTAKAPPRASATSRATVNPFPVVGVGASAGGLEAFTRLLRRLPKDTGMGFVLVQHLDPNHESMLADILSRETAMPVREAENGMSVEPDGVFVIPPNAGMELVDGTFKVVPRVRGVSPPLPVDCFFESLARIQKATAIGVVLSGSASDGAQGLRAIKERGGITFAQDEASAKFNGMPRAAASSGAVDFVLPPEEIAKELTRIARHPHVYAAGTDPAAAPAAEPAVDGLRAIFAMLRSAHGVDFSYYRQSTLRRRLSRRMAVSRVDDLKEYLALLRRNPAEVSALYEDFLITVTSFFRDPEVFAFLQKKVYPALLKGRPPGLPLRAWVPGCSTGEEAYSLAMSLLESFDGGPAFPIQIFATDVSESAIERARAGVYSESSLGSVSAGRQRRFFVKSDGHFQVVKSVRECCIFARQNIAADPSFTNLDLLSCRNLLIYLEPQLQKRLLPQFHHALKPTGYLMLGPAESISGFSDLFAPLDKRHRVFSKRFSAASRQFDFGSREYGEPTRARGPAPALAEGGKPVGADLQREADRLLLARYAPSGVVIDSNLEIVQFRGRTGDFLEGASGAASLNVLRMAREGLLADLRAAIHKARSRNLQVRREGLRLKHDGTFREIDLEVVPLGEAGAGGRHYLVLFETRGGGHGSGRPPAKAAAKRKTPAGRGPMNPREVERLEQELDSTREYLQAVVEEQESANEELKSANEEILSSNEELQSTNEELDTAREELQSANEELTTLNEELQNRNLQLSRVNDDLVNVLASVQLPIVLLGADGRIRRFTPTAETLLGLVPADLGRPVQNLRLELELPDLSGLTKSAMEEVSVQTREVLDREGRWHLLRVHPYRTVDNRIDGAVLVFVGIDEIKKSLLEAERAREMAQAVVQTVREPLLVLDGELRVEAANSAFFRTFEVSPSDTSGRLLYELGDGHWDIPALRRLLEEVVPKNETVEDFEVEHLFRGIGRRVMLLNARQIRLPGERAARILLAIEDVTDRRKDEKAAADSQARYRGLFESGTEGSVVLDPETGRVLDVNPYLAGVLGARTEDLLGKNVWELPFVSGAESLRSSLEAAADRAVPVLEDIVFTTPSGQTVRMEVVREAPLAGGKARHSLRDVTERRRLEEELRQVQKMESIGRLAGGMAHDFNNILNIISAYAEAIERGGSPERQVEALKAIRKSVSRGAGVVRQLLTFARKDDTSFESVDVNSVVREVAELLSETFPRTVTVTLDLAPDVPAIRADSNSLHQMLLNLCVNARDAMPEGGTLTLSTARVLQEEARARFPEASALGYARMAVSDTGTGIDDATRSRLFEPFFTTKEHGAGSGMGLAVVYGVVKAHAGFIEVASEIGEGSTFSLYFPSPSEDQRARLREQPLTAARGGTETILFVEDEPMLLESVKELLEEEGYRVIAARDGREAVEEFRRRRHEIALVVCDLELPEVSGWDAYRAMREIDPGVLAVVVSGYVDPALRAKMMNAGAKEVLRKPYSGDELLRRIREVLDSAAAGEGKAVPKPRRRKR